MGFLSKIGERLCLVSNVGEPQTKTIGQVNNEAALVDFAEQYLVESGRTGFGV